MSQLVVERNGKYDSVNGSKGYRWMESEMVTSLNKEDTVDRTYYDSLVNDAVHDISQYGDFEWFVSNDPFDRADDYETKMLEKIEL